MKVLGVLVLLAGMLVLVGCTAAPVFDVSSTGSLMVDQKPGDKVFLRVTNSAPMAGGMTAYLATQIRTLLENKGYKLVDSQDAARIVLLVNIRYCDLHQRAVQAGNVLLGAGIGAAAGGLGGAMIHTHHHHGRNIVGGALFGAAVGAGTAYLWERSLEKNTFVIMIDARVTNTRKDKTENMTVQATVGEKDLTVDAAGNKAIPYAAGSITGPF